MSIVLEGVSKTFDTNGVSVEALGAVSLTLEMKKFNVLLGPSGCGKTTLLRIVGGLENQTTGTITINGVSPRQAREERKLGMVFQRPALLPWRSVRDNIALPALLAKRSDEIRETSRVESLIALVGLHGFEEAQPHQLSGGMQSRVAIARALVLEPSILLMDEPLGGLDQITREKMQLELARIFETEGTTVLMVTHSISESLLLADRVVVMSARPGRVVEDLDVPFERPRTFELEQDRTFVELAHHLRGQLVQKEELQEAK